MSSAQPGLGDAVVVPAAGLTTLATIIVGNAKLLCFHFDVASQNLDDFDVLARAHPAAALQDFTPGSWTSLAAEGRIRESSGNLAAIAAAGNGYFAMDITGLFEVVVQASAVANNASVTPRWSLT